MRFFLLQFDFAVSLTKYKIAKKSANLMTKTTISEGFTNQGERIDDMSTRGKNNTHTTIPLLFGLHCRLLGERRRYNVRQMQKQAKGTLVLTLAVVLLNAELKNTK
jgi:hypothetical protein